MSIGYREVTDPSERAYRIQQALEWISHAAGKTGFDDDLNRVGSMRENDLLSYGLVKIAGVCNIDPKLIELSAFTDDDQADSMSA